MSRSTRRPWITAALAVLTLATTAVTMTMPVASAQSAESTSNPSAGLTDIAPAQTNAPAGMHRYTVAVGGLSVSSRTNWVRLGTYSFTADNQVTESHFHWTQRRRVSRTSTGVPARDCVARECTVHTANGFQATSAPQRLAGTYSVSGDTLRIEWDGNGWEEWAVTEPMAGKLGKLTFSDSSFGATHGYGYGSDAEWSDRASMSEIAAADHTEFRHRYHLWKTNSGSPYLDEGSGSPFWVTSWDTCASNRCLGARSGTPTEYYVSTANTSSTDRRDTLWHWRTKLADDRGEYCYTGNSHVKPMLQIIDSDGGFHGWVAVEASINQTVPDQGANADDIGVFEISEFS